MRTVTDQIRGGIMWFSVLLTVVALYFTAVVAGMRIDLPEGDERFETVLHMDKVSAVPLSIAAFLLVLTLPRPIVLKRVVLAILACAAVWLFVWHWLDDSAYRQIRLRGGDPERLLQSERQK